MNMDLLERLETNFALRAVPAFSRRSFGGSSKRATAPESRAIAELEGRGGALPKVYMGIAIAGTAALAGGVEYGVYRGGEAMDDHDKEKHGDRDVS
jgi:hypothetical protein